MSVGWPSGLRRQFKALVSSEAWVRIPLQSLFFHLDAFAYKSAESSIRLWVLVLVPCRVIAVVAQLGERQTEDLKVPGSIPGDGTDFFNFFVFFFVKSFFGTCHGFCKRSTRFCFLFRVRHFQKV